MTNDIQVDVIWRIYEANLIFGIMCYLCVFYYSEEQRDIKLAYHTKQVKIMYSLSWNPSNMKCSTRVVPFTVYLLFKPIGSRTTKECDLNCWALLSTRRLTGNISTHIHSYSNIQWIEGLWTHWATTDILAVEQSSKIWYSSAVKESLPPFTKNEDVMCCRNNLMLPMSEWLINVTEKIKTQVNVNSWYLCYCLC